MRLLQFKALRCRGPGKDNGTAERSNGQLRRRQHVQWVAETGMSLSQAGAEDDMVQPANNGPEVTENNVSFSPF